MKTKDGLFQIDGHATRLGYSDAHAGFVTSVTNDGKRLTFSEGKAELLNGPDSGEPDALAFSPGGFVGHTSGNQRWKISIEVGAGHQVFTLRQNGRWVREGESMKNGSRLIVGHSHHYDFNF